MISQEYIEEMLNYPPLSIEEERNMWKRYQDTKSPRLRDKIITSNLRFVVSETLRIHKVGIFQNIELEDLLQAGNMGLIVAFDKFDPVKGYRFITFAKWWVLSYFNRCLDDGSLIHIPQNVRKDLVTCYKDNEESDVSQTVEQCDKLSRRRKDNVLNYPKPVPGEFYRSDHQDHHSRELQELIENVLCEIDRPERDVLIFKSHLIGGETLQDLSMKYDISKQRIGQIVIYIGKIFKKKLNIRGIKEFLDLMVDSTPTGPLLDTGYRQEARDGN